MDKVRLLAGLAAALLLAGCGKVGEGTASGKVWVGEISYPIAHSYVYVADEELWIYLTDAPMSKGDVRDRWAVHDLARAGKLHGVKLRLKPGDSAPTGFDGLLIMPPASAEETLASISRSGSSPAFEAFKVDGLQASGRIRYEQKAIFESPPYGFEASFSAAPG